MSLLPNAVPKNIKAIFIKVLGNLESTISNVYRRPDQAIAPINVGEGIFSFFKKKANITQIIIRNVISKKYFTS